MVATQLYTIVRFRDAIAGAAFLEALGFTRVEWYVNADDPTHVDHATYGWRDNGGVMFGTASDDGPQVARAGAYCVVDDPDEVDRIHSAALAAGGTSERAPENPEYGGRVCSVRDPEGNSWSFGTYNA